MLGGEATSVLARREVEVAWEAAPLPYMASCGPNVCQQRRTGDMEEI